MRLLVTTATFAVFDVLPKRSHRTPRSADVRLPGVARDRRRARQTQDSKRAQAEAELLRREGRRWAYRAVMALIVAVPVFFLSWVVATVLALVAVGFVVQGLRLGVQAERLVA